MLRYLIKKNLIFFLIIILMFSLDRISKEYIIEFFLSYREQSYYLYPFLNLTLVWNNGIAFGLFQSESIFYHLISVMILLVILFLGFWLYRSDIKIEKIALSVVIGGALGNWYDRIRFNAVPDFIDFHYLDFHWFIFNVSDIVITVGIILLLLSELLKKNEN